MSSHMTGREGVIGEVSLEEAVDACERSAVGHDLKSERVPEPRKSAHQRTAVCLRAAAEMLKAFER